MKKIGERIREARLAQGFSQEELATRIGAKYRSVSTWELGTAKPDCLTIVHLCEALKVTPNQLLGFCSVDDIPSVSELTLLRKYREIDEYGKNAVRAVLDAEHARLSEPKRKARLLRIDYYNYPASAGAGNFLENEIPEKILVPDSPEAEAADFVIPISGDSMEPTFHDGDKVFVVKQDAVSKGEIGIFIVNGDAFIKEQGNRCLISHNKAYQPIPLRPTDSIYCCGRVIGIAEK